MPFFCQIVCHPLTQPIRVFPDHCSAGVENRKVFNIGMLGQMPSEILCKIHILNHKSEAFLQMMETSSIKSLEN